MGKNAIKAREEGVKEGMGRGGGRSTKEGFKKKET